MSAGDCDPEDLPAGWDKSSEEGTVVGPTGDREPEPAPGETPDAERSVEHRQEGERLRRPADDPTADDAAADDAGENGGGQSPC